MENYTKTRKIVYKGSDFRVYKNFILWCLKYMPDVLVNAGNPFMTNLDFTKIQQTQFTSNKEYFTNKMKQLNTIEDEEKREFIKSKYYELKNYKPKDVKNYDAAIIVTDNLTLRQMIMLSIICPFDFVYASMQKGRWERKFYWGILKIGKRYARR